MITVTLPKHEYDKTQKDIKELNEKIAKILEQKGSFVLGSNKWNYAFDYYYQNFIFVENSTNEEKEILLTREIKALNLKLKDNLDILDVQSKRISELNGIASSRLDIIANLRKEIDTMKTQHAKEINDLKASFELETVKTKPWWKLF